MTNVAMPRVGNGFDVHALVAGRRLVLGGVTVPFDHGLAGHSDADVLIHAICDAILGAIGDGDIGRHFPDTDPELDRVHIVLGPDGETRRETWS
jgi:2-C-methyl-D-erythritol 2,4-cyclodiphosphate synthase